MAVPTIHLVFKTHLDIGFTDHAAPVRRQYHEQFIPQAIATGEHFFAENPEAPAFIWTTGAWLIWDHLQSQDAARVRRLERAIERGLIAWHGLPFTTHTELMSPALFRAGLSYAEELDQRFGNTTIAAKMTDVPGHTLGMVPLLAAAGIRFLHLGVNTASPVPDVPPIFVWRAPDGAEVVVMYQASYGATDFPAGPDIGLSFAHTNDNIGPQSVGQTVEALRAMRHDHPDARIVASTLDAFGAEMWARRAQFPVLEQEIGDSWIHGTASDPQKLARFRALQRFYDGFETLTPQRRAFGRGLAMVAEHTWGVDVKTYLRDDKAWDRSDFEASRRSDYRFAYAEQSWAEQRGYIDTALQALDGADRAAADAALAGLTPPAPAVPQAGLQLEDKGWTADLDATTGDVLRLVAPDGQVVEGQDGALLGYRHESFDSASLQTHLDSYLQHCLEWAILDHDKPGLERAKTARTARFVPRHLGVDGGVGIAELEPEARDALGGPARQEIHIQGIDADQVAVTLVLRDKPANRMPEAGFFSIRPAGANEWQLEKLGLWHAADNIVRRGGGQLQAVTAMRARLGQGALTVTPLDAALVAPALAPFMPFQPEVPDFGQGVAFNLYNNKWGTNFPMWWEGSQVFRFILRLDRA
ncbi:MAG: DUF5054 domain-containing protein [Candidatus Devosia phytovorans]|uniref:DUF5054 domain-containing protein n=1 Tax=Candidatus Devosia phytovorans TaxID=3121372 RepID=A0AAJ6AYJ2_9HYPH|nr:DUF5054 domain-containing protein [Devosia sp.]WEK02796.1 MAG: DUF5054 domain-containing protein [Devosia sp.]